MTNRLLVFFSILCFGAKAQVPVSREPRHHVVFENKKARILNVLLPPGDTTQYHVHSTPSVFIGLSTSRTGSQLLHQQPVSGTFTAGSVFFEDLRPPHTRTHRVWNMDRMVFHVMDVEILARDSGFTQKPFLAKHVTLEIDTPWVRTYKIELAKNEQLAINEKKRTFILVALKDSKINLSINEKETASFVSAGGFFWLNPNDRFKLTNPGDSMSDFALIEMR
ncbi:MAG: hypothetical protein JWM28_1176 [Chitinophagaceae bacterium]|nr:hypothetical protein [Chitinophagaceae bacterium]